MNFTFVIHIFIFTNLAYIMDSIYVSTMLISNKNI